MAKIYTLHINAYSPETIPMARLAQYMQSLADMLCHDGAVHFDGLRAGSTQLVSRIDHEQVPKVGAVLDALQRGEGAPEAIRAQEAIDKLLADDNATGFLYEDDDPGAKIIAFPGVSRPRPAQYGPIKQEGSLDGILVSVGGADKTVHVRLQQGDLKFSNIDTDRETARRLGKYLFEPIRVFGTGSWLREENGDWSLKRFKVEHFEVLKTDDLRDVIEELRSVEGSEWTTQDDALGKLRAMRDEGNGPH
jgi:hypothetical protein